MPRAWTRDELIVAMNLYSRLTFGQLHARNALIVETAAAMDRSPNSLAMKLCNLASLDPAVTSRGRVGLKGASQLDREVWNAFQTDWETMGIESEHRFNKLLGNVPVIEIEDRWTLREGPTEVESVTRRRLGQDFFRRTVLVSYNQRCCITGTPIPALLSASHIVAWSADHTQRLNPHNGLCLAKTQDAAFDRHIITLDEDLRLVLSKSIRDHFSPESVRANFQPTKETGSTCLIDSLPSPHYCNVTGIFSRTLYDPLRHFLHTTHARTHRKGSRRENLVCRRKR